MTKTDIGIYRGLKEKFDPEVHVGFFITTDTGELLLGDQSLGQTISGWEINDGILILKLNTGRDIRVTFPEATETVKGLLSAADKAQLNALQANLDSKVDKVTGKSLLADSEIEKLAGLPNSAELTNSIATAKAAGDNAQSDLNAHKQNKSNPHEVTKAQVGLGNVTNDAQVKRSEMGVANGVATLDADGKVPASQLPSYVDDIIDVYATYSKSDTGVLSNVTLYLDAAHTQLVTGEAGKIYQNVADGEPKYQFRWTGTIFSQTGASSLILGEVTGTAYDGAKGKANADNIAKIKGTSLSHIKDAAPITAAADKVSLNYECFEGNQYGVAGTAHTADIPAATTAKAGVMSAADKTKLEGVEAGAQVNAVTSVAGKTGAVTLAKADVGLGNVDNTSDANKPVSTAQATAIADAKKAGTDAQAAVEAEATARATAITDAVNALNATITSTDGTNVQVKVTETNGKITAVNITTDNTAKNSDLTAEVTRAKAAEADAKKAGTDAQTALNTYKVSNDAAVEAVTTDLANHKLDKDKKHIPAGGHERQILAWDEDGKAKWDDLANMFTGLEELLAYGVEWKDNVADPHLTRIGNMSLHKTLPIQSQLKGCIAQRDKVIYWLDENDWRFRKNPQTIQVNLTESTTEIEVVSLTSLNLGVGQYLRNGKSIAKIKEVNTEDSKIIVEWENQEGEVSELTSLEIGSRLDGYDGTVRVYCPSFYIKSFIIGDIRRVLISTVKIDNTWTYQHEILLDAYRSTVLRTVPENMGYLSTLPVNSAISVVNTNAYCRGGDNSTSYDQYLETDPFRSQLGKPATYISRANMRTYSRNAGNEMMSYNQYKNIFYWLWVIEYANFNSQEAFKEELTENGYHQGGMGGGVTTIDSACLSYYNNYYPLTPCGYGNDLGNGTGIKDMVVVTPITSGGEPTRTYTFQVPRWRGFDNPFGDIWTNLDGIVIERTTDLSNVWTTDDVSEYTDVIGNKTLAGKECLGEGYIKLFDLGETAEIIPSVHGTSTTQYKCDYHWRDPSTSGLRRLLVGGSAYDGGFAGLGYFGSSYDVSGSNSHIGFRSVSSFVSFSDSEG